jgi:signal transduction histidine kinase
MLRTGPAAALAVLGATANFAGAALFADAAPYVGFLDLVRTALPGISFAAAALVVATWGRGGLGTLALAATSLVNAAPFLSIGLDQRSGAWVAVGAVGQLVAPLVVVVALLFPSGRLMGTVRRVATALVLLAGLTAGAIQALSHDPGGWQWCRCVDNPLAVLDVGPGDYAALEDRLLLVQLAVAVIGLVALVVTLRRAPQGVVLAFAATFAVLAGCWIIADVAALRSVDDAPATVRAVRDAALVILPVLYAVGFGAHRPSRAHVADLLLAARGEPQTLRLQTLVGRAIGDPGATVAWWQPERAEFRDLADRPVEAPERGVLRVEAEGRPIAVVRSERIDSVEPGVRDSVAEALLLAGENRRLTTELRASLDQVRDSRARIVAAGDDSRRRIERDLHDGAQQLLISTGIKLNLAAARVGTEDVALTGVLDEASAELNRALAELRSLASGIAPTSLVHGNLDSALRELALRSRVPAAVRVTGEPEPDERTTSTVYFVVAECLANVAKHSTAGHVSVDVELGDPVRVNVADDGQGGATLVGPGTGLRGLVDRVESRGGRLELVSGSSGTTVTATVPAQGLDQ